MQSAWGTRASKGGGGPKLQGQQLADVLCVAMFAATFGFLWCLDAGAIYFWMKDLTQEFLKLQVIYTAVEMFDKVRASLFCPYLLHRAVDFYDCGINIQS